MSSTSSLTEDVDRLSSESAENDAAMKTATDVRQKEKAEFMVVEKHLSESPEACAAATEVLREYYEVASLFQVEAGSKEVTNAEGDGTGILRMLEGQRAASLRALRRHAPLSSSPRLTMTR